MSVELISVLIAVLAIGRQNDRADPDQQSLTAGGHGQNGGTAARRHESAIRAHGARRFYSQDKFEGLTGRIARGNQREARCHFENDSGLSLTFNLDKQDLMRIVSKFHLGSSTRIVGGLMELCIGSSQAFSYRVLRVLQGMGIDPDGPNP